MKYGRSLQELAIELDRQAKVKKDYVATAGAMQMTAVNENFDLVIGNTPFQLNENAHRQLGLQLKIPAPYYERMRAENPGLLMANVNGWFQQSPDTRRMVRTLDGTARAILSDRYRRIDNYEVAQTVLPIISEMQGARIESCELTDADTRNAKATWLCDAAKHYPSTTYLKFILPTIRRGCTGDANRAATKMLQRLLGLTPDGIFGEKTENALLKAQEKHKLAVDGICGPASWRAISGANKYL